MFIFFFFLSTWLLVAYISLGKEEEWEEGPMGEEGRGST
jgi:hypothetical protein